MTSRLQPRRPRLDRATWPRALAVAVASLVGCGERPTPPRPRRDPTGLPRAGEAQSGAPHLRVAGRRYALRHARASIGTFDTLAVELSDQPLAAGQASTGNAVRVELPAGPSRRYFAGTEVPMAVLVRVAGENRTNEIPAYRARVRLEPFRRAVGEHVRGTISCRGSADFGDVATHMLDIACEGAFDVPIEAIEADYDGTAPASVGSGPVAGRFDGQPFTAGSVLAVLGIAPDGARYVKKVLLFEAAGVTCDRRHEVAHTRPFVLVAPWGGDGIAARTGVAMPVTPGYGFDNASAAWVRFDAIELVPNGSVRGALYEGPSRADGATGEPDFLLAGTFSGLVCSDTPDPYLLPPP